MPVNTEHNTVTPRLGLGALLLLGSFAWAPALYPGYWQTLQGFVPIFNVGMPAAIANVGVEPDLWRGTGNATNLLAQPWALFGADPATSVRLAFLLAFVIGGCAIYAWLRPVFGDRASGLAGLVYMLQPIFLSTAYVHGSLADALVLAWLPLALAGLSASARHRSVEGAAVAVIAIVALWRTQAGLALPASALLLLYAIVVERHWVPVLVTLTASVAAAFTLLPLWSLSAPAPVPFADHFVYLHQLLAVQWEAASSAAGGQDRYPFQLGFSVLLFSTLSCWGWATAARRRLAAPQNWLFGFSLCAGLGLIALSLPWSALLWQVSGAERLLTYPWQILLLAAPLLAVTAGVLPLVLPDLSTPPLWSILVALTVLGSYPALAPIYTTVQPPSRPLAMIGANQLAVLSATVHTAEQEAVLDITWQVIHPLLEDDNIFFQAISGASADERVVAQLDMQPLGDANPATNWQPGQIFTTRYTLPLEQPVTDAPLRYYFGFYDWRSGQRLPVNGGIDDKLVLHAR
jgi:hypothetical protein